MSILNCKRKKIILFIITIVLGACGNLTAQVAINTDGSAPETSAILDIKSTTGGVLFPRMTTIERNAIVLPDTSLIIYNTDLQTIQFWDGSNWTTVILRDCAPGQPGNITGDMYTCDNQSGLTYSISPVAEATSYNWTVPPGATIISGQGTTNITVDMGTQNGNVSVKAQSGCGNSTYKDLSITVDTPVQPGNIKGNIGTDF